MNSSTKGDLEDLLRENELEWVIQWFVPPGSGINALRRFLEDATQESRKRFGLDGPQFTEDTLIQESHRNPHKVRAFLQALVATRKPHMLVMVWRILQGMRIQQIEMTYLERKSFRLRCVLNSPYEEKPEVYESEDIVDAMLLRHLGIMEMSEGPVFEGFYPLQFGRMGDQENECDGG